MGSRHKNIQLMLEFLIAPFLVLHFSYYTVMNFLMLSVILLSMLMILLSVLNVIKHLIRGNNLNCLLNLNLIYKILWLGQEVADLNAGKTQLLWFDWSNNTGSIDKKMDGSVLEEKHLLRCWGWPSLLNWIGASTLSCYC